MAEALRIDARGEGEMNIPFNNIYFDGTVQGLIDQLNWIKALMPPQRPESTLVSDSNGRVSNELRIKATRSNRDGSELWHVELFYPPPDLLQSSRLSEEDKEALIE